MLCGKKGRWERSCGTGIKTARTRTTPQRIYGRVSGRKCSARRKGVGRGLAELE